LRKQKLSLKTPELREPLKLNFSLKERENMDLPLKPSTWLLVKLDNSMEDTPLFKLKLKKLDHSSKSHLNHLLRSEKLLNLLLKFPNSEPSLNLSNNLLMLLVKPQKSQNIAIQPTLSTPSTLFLEIF
jgi:hypothetical protein